LVILAFTASSRYLEPVGTLRNASGFAGAVLAYLKEKVPDGLRPDVARPES
jgi:hypothetical protein